MKTIQVLSRPFMGREVRQRHNDQYFCVNDLTETANKIRKLTGLSEVRWDNYVANKSTQEFFDEIIKQKGIADIVESKKGRYGGTWVHPLVFLDYAMWVSPEFKVYVYEWLYDCLTIYRDDSGDSYKRMCSSLCESQGIGGAKATLMIQSLAKAIKRDLGCIDGDWNRCDAETLKKRDTIHKSMEMLLEAGVEPVKAYNSALKSVGVEKK